MSSPQVIDTKKAARQTQQRRVEAHRQKLIEWCRKQVENCVWLENPATDPTLIERQMGKPMHSNELERRLRLLVPSIRFEYGVHNSTDKVIIIGATRIPYESGIMPEHSVMARHYEDVPDVDVISGKKRIERADLPKHEWTGWRTGYRFDDTVPMAGFKRTAQPWREEKRGWRTVLLRLVVAGALSPAAVERVFGSDNRAEWAGHIGKRAVTTPW